VICNIQNFLMLLTLIDALVNPREVWLVLPPVFFITINLYLTHCMNRDRSYLSYVPLILSTMNTILLFEWEI